MFIIVACEYSNIVSQAFRNRGHKVLSVDLEPNDVPGTWHIQDDIFTVLRLFKPDMIVGHPPCTFLCKAQMFMYKRVPGRWCKAIYAADFFRQLYNWPCPLIALENPIGYLSRIFRPPDQIIQPRYFGDPYRKDVCLWLKGLPPLIHGCLSPGRKSVSNHVNSRMSQEQKSKIKSRFFSGIAEAMATQWNY